MRNFYEIATALLEADGVLEVQHSEALSERVSALLQQSEHRQALGEAAYQVLRDDPGAITRTVQLVKQVLSQPTRA